MSQSVTNNRQKPVYGESEVGVFSVSISELRDIPLEKLVFVEYFMDQGLEIGCYWPINRTSDGVLIYCQNQGDCILSSIISKENNELIDLSRLREGLVGATVVANGLQKAKGLRDVFGYPVLAVIDFPMYEALAENEYKEDVEEITCIRHSQKEPCAVANAFMLGRYYEYLVQT